MRALETPCAPPLSQLCTGRLLSVPGLPPEWSAFQVSLTGRRLTFYWSLIYQLCPVWSVFLTPQEVFTCPVTGGVSPHFAAESLQAQPLGVGVWDTSQGGFCVWREVRVRVPSFLPPVAAHALRCKAREGEQELVGTIPAVRTWVRRRVGNQGEKGERWLCSRNFWMSMCLRFRDLCRL